MSSSPAPSSLDHEMSPVPINAVLTESSFYPVGLIKPSGEATVKVHPLDELTPDEVRGETPTILSSHGFTEFSLSQIQIIMIGAAVKSHITWYRREIKALKFMSAGVVPPPKRDVLAFLHIPVEPGKPAETPPEYLLRRAETDFIDPLTGFGYNAILSFSREKHIWKVDAIKQLPEGVHPQLTVEELLQMDELVRHDPTILELAAKVEPDQLCADGWSVGCDERWPNSMRLQQCIMYARFVPDSNLYAHPLDFLPVVDVNSKKVLHVDFPPMRTSEGLTSPTTAGPPLSSDPLKASGRERHAPPRGRCEYLPDLMDESMKPRRRPEPLKPLHISQPEGVSFKFTDGNTLEWQNWTMHVAFSAREGIALSTITWNDDGRIRPIFYRLSTAEMVVPYAAPEHPHPRKCAFDV
ncbi:hypothetical protein FRB99_004096 [Tulasnella sp. 403]|nr:hypothetical protein FRB99_004096 [Tulasnella sp. 403]